jgi:hypothetical protein
MAGVRYGEQPNGRALSKTLACADASCGYIVVSA